MKFVSFRPAASASVYVTPRLTSAGSTAIGLPSQRLGDQLEEQAAHHRAGRRRHRGRVDRLADRELDGLGHRAEHAHRDAAIARHEGHLLAGRAAGRRRGRGTDAATRGTHRVDRRCHCHCHCRRCLLSLSLSLFELSSLLSLIVVVVIQLSSSSLSVAVVIFDCRCRHRRRRHRRRRCRSEQQWPPYGTRTPGTAERPGAERWREERCERHRQDRQRDEEGRSFDIEGTSTSSG